MAYIYQCISNQIITWFYNLISNISQITRVEYFFSNICIVKYGVYQRISFGFNFILLYINDIKITITIC